jgi:hypothetical protein
MATYTINATTNQGYVRSQASNYNNARAGSGSKSLTQSTSQVAGQQFLGGVHYIDEAFLEFDTSTITGTISSVVLKVYITNIYADNSFTCQARLYDYGTSLTTADWVPGADVSGDTLLATLASGSMSANAYNSFTNVAFPANINTSGKTRFYLTTDNFASATSPGSNEKEAFIFQSPTGTNVPQLVVVTSESTGTASLTQANATISAAVSIETHGASDLTTANASMVSTASIIGAGEGTSALSLADATVSATVGIETFAYLDLSLSDATLSTVALVDLNGAADIDAADATVSAVAAWNTTGSASMTLADAVVTSSTEDAIQGAVTVTLSDAVVSATQSAVSWPTVYAFPQSPLTGTWRRTPADDTLRSDREVGARQYRARQSNNYSDATFAIMLKTAPQRTELDRFFEEDCASGAKPFTWADPETGDVVKWTWAEPPVLIHVASDTYRVECAVRREMV